MFPMKMPRGLSKSQARVIILCIWIAAAIVASPWIIAFRVVHSGRDNQDYCLESWPESMDSKIYFLIGNLILCYGLPLTLITINNGLIWWRVSGRKVPNDSASPAEIQRIHRKTRHAVIRSLSVVTLTFLISWLPLYIIILRIKFGGPIPEHMENIISIALPFAQWLGTSNSSCNPILYTFLNKKFRDSFKSLIFRPG
jgi:neuropeptide FF receptor 2